MYTSCIHGSYPGKVTPRNGSIHQLKILSPKKCIYIYIYIYYLVLKTKYVGEVDGSKLQEVFRKSMVNKDMLLLCRFKLLPSLLITVKRFSHPPLSSREESLLQTRNFPGKCKFLLQKNVNFSSVWFSALLLYLMFLKNLLLLLFNH